MTTRDTQTRSVAHCVLVVTMMHHDKSTAGSFIILTETLAGSSMRTSPIAAAVSLVVTTIVGLIVSFVSSIRMQSEER